MTTEWIFDGSGKLNLEVYPTRCMSKDDKEKIMIKFKENQLKMMELQDKLYAQGNEGIIIILQALDAAGKDGTIRHALGPLNPAGVDVINFKQPSTNELAHDFLWRANKSIPPRGKIAVFNRSYYEDVLVVKIHNLQENYKLTSRCMYSKEEFFKKRYQHIKNYEEYLYDNGYRIIKIFLHVSKEEQKKRFLYRIDDEHKNWKFSSSDLKERQFFDKYMKVYQEAIQETSTKHAPWYILPADQKWYTRYLVSKIVLEVLEDCNPKYPKLPSKDLEALSSCKAQLENE